MTVCCSLLVLFHQSLAPFKQVPHGVDKLFTGVSQVVSDGGRDRPLGLALEETVFLQLPQALGQHGIGNAADAAFELIIMLPVIPRAGQIHRRPEEPMASEIVKMVEEWSTIGKEAVKNG